MHLLKINATGVPVVDSLAVLRERACFRGVDECGIRSGVPCLAQGLGGLGRFGFIASLIGKMASVTGGTHF